MSECDHASTYDAKIPVSGAIRCVQCGCELLDVALCENCSGTSNWLSPKAHPWHIRRCTFCGSERVSRVLTDKRNLRDLREGDEQ